jgi:hypothetical protein
MLCRSLFLSASSSSKMRNVTAGELFPAGLIATKRPDRPPQKAGEWSGHGGGLGDSGHAARVGRMMATAARPGPRYRAALFLNGRQQHSHQDSDDRNDYQASFHLTQLRRFDRRKGTQIVFRWHDMTS